MCASRSFFETSFRSQSRVPSEYTIGLFCGDFRFHHRHGHSGNPVAFRVEAPIASQDQDWRYWCFPPWCFVSLPDFLCFGYTDRMIRTVAASITRMVTFVHTGQARDAGDDDYKCQLQSMILPYKIANETCMIDFTAPTIYWTMIESSLSIVSACLPTLRPLFHGHSPESMVRSVRSAISLASLRSQSRQHPELSRAQEVSPSPSVIGINQKKQASFESSDQPRGNHHTVMSQGSTLDRDLTTDKTSPSGVVLQKGWSKSDDLV